MFKNSKPDLIHSSTKKIVIIDINKKCDSDRTVQTVLYIIITLRNVLLEEAVVSQNKTNKYYGVFRYYITTVTDDSKFSMPMDYSPHYKSLDRTIP